MKMTEANSLIPVDKYARGPNVYTMSFPNLSCSFIARLSEIFQDESSPMDGEMNMYFGIRKTINNSKIIFSIFFFVKKTFTKDLYFILIFCSKLFHCS